MSFELNKTYYLMWWKTTKIDGKRFEPNLFGARPFQFESIIPNPNHNEMLVARFLDGAMEPVCLYGTDSRICETIEEVKRQCVDSFQQTLQEKVEELMRFRQIQNMLYGMDENNIESYLINNSSSCIRLEVD